MNYFNNYDYKTQADVIETRIDIRISLTSTMSWAHICMLSCSSFIKAHEVGSTIIFSIIQMWET